MTHRQSVIGDFHRRHHDRCECVEDGGKAQDRELYRGAKGNPRDHENTTVQQSCASADRCAAEEEGQQQGWQGCKKKSSEKVKDDDQRKCHHCREAGRTKSRSRTRSKDLTDAVWKPVIANSQPSSIPANAPLADDHVIMFLETSMRAALFRVRTRGTHICDSDVRDMSDDRHMCGGRYLSRRI